MPSGEPAPDSNDGRMEEGGVLKTLRRERRPMAALAAALLLFYSLLVALGIASQAVAATSSDAPFFVLCEPSGQTAPGDEDGNSHIGKPCVLCQAQATSEAPSSITRPKRRLRSPAATRPAFVAPRPRHKGHLRPPNRAPPSASLVCAEPSAA
jgi:hypothetical protein